MKFTPLRLPDILSVHASEEGFSFKHKCFVTRKENESRIENANKRKNISYDVCIKQE